MTVPDPLLLNVLEVDRDAIADNMRAVRRLVGRNCTIFGTLKADAYGLGAAGVAPTILANGADGIGVEDLTVAIKLRESGVMAPILLFPCALPSAAAAFVANGLTPVVDELDWARAVSQVATKQYEVFVRLDVALQGTGVSPSEALALLIAMAALPKIKIAGLCAHIPSRATLAETLQQHATFKSIVALAREAGLEIPLRLLASSSLLQKGLDPHFNAVDPGRMLLGLSDPDQSRIQLRPAFHSLRARLISVKEPDPLARTGGGSKGVSQRVGVIPFGSADGLHVANAGHVLVRGEPASLLGQPQLEHTRLDLGAIPSARVGDDVVIIGRQGESEIRSEDVARSGGVKVTQIATSLGQRVLRTYI